MGFAFPQGSLDPVPPTANEWVRFDTDEYKCTMCWNNVCVELKRAKGIQIAEEKVLEWSGKKDDRNLNGIWNKHRKIEMLWEDSIIWNIWLWHMIAM